MNLDIFVTMLNAKRSALWSRLKPDGFNRDRFALVQRSYVTRNRLYMDITSEWRRYPFNPSQRVSVGVGYTWPSLRFLTFIFFSLTYLIVITNSKKSFENIISKKIPGCFIEWHRAGSIFAPQKPMKLDFFNKWSGIFFEMIFLKDFFGFVISIRYVNEKKMKVRNLSTFPGKWTV